ncbi:hypothetical protein [Vibrio splendidus]|uniref:hypothetical protein n=1 Tax=Vibrio splendidus TaxID=29497 RepID=UPI0034A0BDF1
MSIIYRETSLELASEMINSCKLPPSDLHAKCANFYLEPKSTSNVQDKGLILAFSWSGNEEKVVDTHNILSSDILYHMSTNATYNNTGRIYNPETYWISRIYSSNKKFLCLTEVIITTDFPSELTKDEDVKLQALKVSAENKLCVAVA